MITLYVPVLPESKPTGNLGRGTKVYQNTPKYKSYKKDSLYWLRKQWGTNAPLETCYGIGLFIYVPRVDSRPKDLGQLAGAAYDILSLGKIWKDDNINVFRSSLVYVRENIYVQGTVFKLCDKPEDWVVLRCHDDHYISETMLELGAYSAS